MRRHCGTFARCKQLTSSPPYVGDATQVQKGTDDRGALERKHATIATVCSGQCCAPVFNLAPALLSCNA